ncbi:MAG TPA: hypothetical protein VIJ87_21270 [Pyrinomonadaceae bacterium]|jgi:hypothetical protein
MAETPSTVSFQEKRAAYSMDERKKPVPAYTIEPMKRKTVVNRTVKDEIGFRIVPTDVEVEGYMVRTLRGDSVFLSHEDVVRLKLDRNLVPMLIEGGDDTPVGMQQMNAALSDKQKTALDVLTRLVESDPSLVEKLLASKEPEQVEE